MSGHYELMTVVRFMPENIEQLRNSPWVKKALGLIDQYYLWLFGGIYQTQHRQHLTDSSSAPGKRDSDIIPLGIWIVTPNENL